MKYLRRFDNLSQYNYFIESSEYIEPNVTDINNGQTVKYGKTKPKYYLDLLDSDFMKRTNQIYDYPYYSTATNYSPRRTTYPYFDLDIFGGRTYKIQLICNWTDVWLGCHFYTQQVRDLTSNRSYMNINNYCNDPGWKHCNEPFVHYVPEYVGSESAINRIVGIHMTMKANQADTMQFSDSFFINHLIIESID